MEHAINQTEKEMLDDARRGGQAGWEGLIDTWRDRLRMMIAFRMDPRLKGRIDPSDVIQEAMIDSWKRLPEYLENPKVPVYVWLRGIAQQRLGMLRRVHLESQKRTVHREVQLHQDDSSSVMAFALIDGSADSPSQDVLKQELIEKVQNKLMSMDAVDREVLALRHFEQLGNSEVSAVLGISEQAASLRYSRALQRLKAIISEMKGMSGELE